MPKHEYEIYVFDINAKTSAPPLNETRCVGNGAVAATIGAVLQNPDWDDIQIRVTIERVM